jgi:hypothetical protein
MQVQVFMGNAGEGNTGTVIQKNRGKEEIYA